MEQEAVGYERDIRPLFREKDVSSMSMVVDLPSYNGVRANGDRILAKLSDRSMPLRRAFGGGAGRALRSWVDAGCPA